MKINIKKIPFGFLIFLVLAILIRLFLIRWSLQFPLNGDFLRYEDWGRIAHIYGLADTYSPLHLLFSKPLPNNQPPGTLYILSGTYELYIQVGKFIGQMSRQQPGSMFWVNTRLLHIFMHFPSLLADILMGSIAYIFIKRTSQKKFALLGTIAIWFNPVIIYNSALWGQLDSLNNLFFLLSLFFAFEKKYFFSIFSLAISFYIKLSLLPLLPFYLVFLYYISHKQWKKIFIFLSISIFLLIIATFPISANPLIWLSKELPLITRGELQNITSTAFNFWWLVSCLADACKTTPHESVKFLGLTLGIWGYLLFFLGTLPFFYITWKNPKKIITQSQILLIFSLITLLTFVFLPKMHDRYLYPFFPLLAIAMILQKNKIVFISIFVLSILMHLCNLLYSWYPSYFPSVWFYYILYNRIFVWSLSALCVGIGILLSILTWRSLIRETPNK